MIYRSANAVLPLTFNITPTMSHTWKRRKLMYTGGVEEEKNNRHRFIVFYKCNHRYIQIHRAASACRHSDEPGIRSHLLPPDPWEDINIHHYFFLKPLRHSRLERHRAARKAAIRDMDARLSSQDYSG